MESGTANTAVDGQPQGLRQWPAQLLQMIQPAAAITGRVLVVGNDAGELPRPLSDKGYEKLNDSELPHIPHDDESFDIVILYGVLDTSAQPKKIMTAVRRVLRPGGHALVVVPQQGSSESSLRWFLGRYFDVLSLDHERDGHNATPLFFVNCQKVTRTAGFWDLVTRQHKF